METKHLRMAIAVVLALLVVIPFGCILDPEEEPPPDETEPPPWGDLTHKDDIVTNMLLVYKHKEIEPYEELLHEQYLWYMQMRDLEPGEEPMTVRDDDIKMTKGIIDNAIRLELKINPGGWAQVHFIGEEPCEDCWETTRGYTITAQFEPEGTIYNGDEKVQLIVVPLTDGNGDPILNKDGKKQYRLRFAYDLEK